jgi:hypothetical protein
LLFSVWVDDEDDDDDDDDDAILTNNGSLLEQVEEGLANVENADVVVQVKVLVKNSKLRELNLIIILDNIGLTARLKTMSICFFFYFLLQ